MPLVPCGECAQTVSTEAAACPRCGVPDPTRVSARRPVAPDNAERSNSPPAWIAGLAFLGFLSVCSSLSTEPETTQSFSSASSDFSASNNTPDPAEFTS